MCSCSSKQSLPEKEYFVLHKPHYVGSFRVVEYLNDKGILCVPFETDNTGYHHKFHNGTCQTCHLSTKKIGQFQCIPMNPTHVFELIKNKYQCIQCKCDYLTLNAYITCENFDTVTKPYTSEHKQGYIGSYEIISHIRESTFNKEALFQRARVRIPPEKDGTGYAHEFDGSVNDFNSSCIKCFCKPNRYLLGIQCLPVHESHVMNKDPPECINCGVSPLTVGSMKQCR